MLVLKEFANFVNSNLANLATTFAQLLGKASLEYEAISVNSRTMTGRRLLKAVAEACESQTSMPLSRLFRNDLSDQLNSRWAAEIIPPNPLLEIECLGQTLTPVLTSLEAGRFVWDMLAETRLALLAQPQAVAGGEDEMEAVRQPYDQLDQQQLESDLRRYRSQLVTLQKKLAEHEQIEQDLIKYKLAIERSGDAIFLTAVDGTILYVNSAFEQIYGYSREEAVGQTPRILKSGLLSQEVYEHFWQSLLVEKQIIAGEIVNKTKSGRLINIEGNNNPILDGQDNLIGFLAVHRDITERKKVEDERMQLLTTLQDQAEHLTRLNEIAAALALSDTLDEIFEVVATKAGEVVTGDRITITLLDETGESFEYRALHGEGVQVNQLPVNNTLVGDVTQAGQVVITPDLKAVAHRVDAGSLVEQGFLSAIAAPLWVSGRVIGTLNIVCRTPAAYTPGDSSLLAQLASVLASAIENRRLFAEMRQRSSRERMIREITEKMRSAASLSELVKITTEELSQHFPVDYVVTKLGLEESLPSPQPAANGHNNIWE
ncbi:MAG TPA: PAS domain S-box protein [Anaerolineae bacterium]|nr:PAS domain S-box protein [Anaerolineae bacterium]HMR62617.1 PAS domain S-box protein [Anaerolineae bacterium]